MFYFSKASSKIPFSTMSPFFINYSYHHTMPDMLIFSMMKTFFESLNELSHRITDIFSSAVTQLSSSQSTTKRKQTINGKHHLHSKSTILFLSTIPSYHPTTIIWILFGLFLIKSNVFYITTTNLFL